jgi:hypothetical protein
MPILVNIFSNDLSTISKSIPTNVYIIDRLLNKTIYQNKIKTSLKKLYPEYKNLIDTTFQKPTKYFNIIKNLNGTIIECSVKFN